MGKSKSKSNQNRSLTTQIGAHQFGSEPALGSKHNKTLSLAKASFGAGPVPAPAVLVLDPAVLALSSMDMHALTLEYPQMIDGYPWITHGHL